MSTTRTPQPGYTDAQYAEPYTPTVEDIWEAVLYAAITMNGGQEIDETELRAMYERFLERVGEEAIDNYEEAGGNA